MLVGDNVECYDLVSVIINWGKLIMFDLFMVEDCWDIVKSLFDIVVSFFYVY